MVGHEESEERRRLGVQALQGEPYPSFADRLDGRVLWIQVGVGVPCWDVGSDGQQLGAADEKDRRDDKTSGRAGSHGCATGRAEERCIAALPTIQRAADCTPLESARAKGERFTG